MMLLNRSGGIRTHDLCFPKAARYSCATPRKTDYDAVLVLSERQ